jgi:hypothetical protein
MMRRFIKDEDGVALGIAVILIVIVGVMGAGLLVFVRNDLQAVVEVNRGEKAFNIADAGVEAAKQQLLMDATRQHYDLDLTNDCTPESRLGADWSPSTTVYENPDCSGAEVPRDPPGVTKDFAGGKFNVTIQCLNQDGDPAPRPCSGVSESAPESVPASEETFFKVVSTGYYPADESGAKRKIEAIFSTSEANVPQAYYTPGDIEFSGNVDISGVSFFSQGNIRGSNGGSVSIDRGPATPYGDWDTRPDSNYNTEPRTDALGSNVEGAGLAAEGTICDGNDCSTSAADGEYDYDSTTTTQFYRKPEANLLDTNEAGKITYPYNPYESYDLDLLKSIAMSQSGNSADGNNFYSVGGNSTMVEHDANGDIKYPEVSTSSSVVYIQANGNDVTYSVNNDPDPKAEGIVVIENGNLKMGNSSSGFRGAFIVTGDGSTTGEYTSSGRETVEGYVIADGEMTISGGVDPFVANAGFIRQPGNYNVEQWSWRELYE